MSIPYMAIATRTRSKVLQESSNEKEFEDFLNKMVTSVKDDDTSSASYTMSSSSSSSSSSYYWSAESPNSVVPGSTSSDDTSTVTSNHVCTDDYVSDNNISIQGSSDGNIASLPGLTQSVDTDLKVSISSAFTWLYNVHTLLQEILTFWHFTQNISFCIFQFPQDWPSHIHCLAVFPHQVPIPVEWLELKNIENSYHPSCQCELPSPWIHQRPSCLVFLPWNMSKTLPIWPLQICTEHSSGRSR